MASDCLRGGASLCCKSFLGGDGRAGHYGLPGMRERAKLVGGKFAVWSKLDSGTEAELTIPASVA